MKKSNIVVGRDVLNNLKEFRDSHASDIRKFLGKAESDQVTYEDLLKYMLSVVE